MNTKTIIEKFDFIEATRRNLFHPTRFFYALVFVLFTIMFMTYAPKFVAHYIHIDYYTVRQPVTVDKEVYHSGEKIVATVVRTSSINVSAHSTVQIYLVNANGELYKHAPLFDGNVIVEKSTEIIAHLTYMLPTDIPDGKYYIKALIDYPNPKDASLRVDYIWITNVFTVSNVSIENN